VTDGPAGAGISRRRLLGSVTAALPVAALPWLLTACKGVQALGTPPPPSPAVVSLRAAIAAEELMVATSAAAIAHVRAGAAPGGSALAALRTVQAEHIEHLAQLRSRLIEPTGAPSPHASPVASSRPSPLAAAAGSPSDILTALGHAEQAASDRLIGELAGLPSTLAQLFASIAASEATHVPFLQAAGRNS
jgi:hypothetical protein